MAPNVRLWQRDLELVREAARSPLRTTQIARLLSFPSAKKAAERLLPLYQAGMLQRVAYFQPRMQGKPEYVYYTGARPHPRALQHTLVIADGRVQSAEWERANPSYTLEFFYGHEVRTTSGLVPDAILIVHKSARTALLFVEVDQGTEPVTSTAGYSLAKKLRSYAEYFDAASYQEDFAWAGALQGFRVALILPRARLRQVQHLVASEHHDFVLTTTADLFRQGLHRPIWVTHDNTTVDLLGRPAQAAGIAEGRAS